jgi:hypothetical protein
MITDTLILEFIVGVTLFIAFSILFAKLSPKVLQDYCDSSQLLLNNTMEGQQAVIKSLSIRMASIDKTLQITEEKLIKASDLAHKRQLRNSKLIALWIETEPYLDKGRVPDNLINEWRNVIGSD